MSLKVLILCKDYPPSNRIGGKRPFAWHKYLRKFGVESTIITSTLSNKNEPGVIRVVCHTSYLNDTVNVSGLSLFKRKIGSFFDLWLPLIYPTTSRLRNLFNEADKLLSAEKYDCIIATGEPFILFKFASVLSVKHSLPWIPDYRDNWSNEPTRARGTINTLFLNNFWKVAEKKLLPSTNHVLTVGAPTAERVKNVNSKPEIHIIENGHDIPAQFQPSELPANLIRITHIGRLYKHRNPGLVLNGIREWIKQNPDQKIEILFIGVEDFPSHKSLLLEMAGDIKSVIKTTKSLEYSDMIRLASGSHAFLQLADPILPLTNGKMYDYLGMKRPILLVPDDKSVFKEIIKKEDCGYILNTADDIIELLNTFKINLSNPEFFTTNTDTYEYSRCRGAEQLSELLKSILN